MNIKPGDTVELLEWPERKHIWWHEKICKTTRIVEALDEYKGEVFVVVTHMKQSLLWPIKHCRKVKTMPEIKPGDRVRLLPYSDDVARQLVTPKWEDKGISKDQIVLVSEARKKMISFEHPDRGAICWPRTAVELVEERAPVMGDKKPLDRDDAFWAAHNESVTRRMDCTGKYGQDRRGMLPKRVIEYAITKSDEKGMIACLHKDDNYSMHKKQLVELQRKIAEYERKYGRPDGKV